MFSMHERRKSVSLASVIWYVVSFGQFRTDRPVRLKTRADFTLFTTNQWCYLYIE
jgi:hypothetical protein